MFFIFTSFHNRNENNDVSNPANLSIEERASILAAKYSSNYGTSRITGGGSQLKREDSTDDLMKSITLANSRRAKRIEDMMKVGVQSDQ